MLISQIKLKKNCIKADSQAVQSRRKTNEPTFPHVVFVKKKKEVGHWFLSKTSEISVLVQKEKRNITNREYNCITVFIDKDLFSNPSEGDMCDTLLWSLTLIDPNHTIMDSGQNSDTGQLSRSISRCNSLLTLPVICLELLTSTQANILISFLMA